MGQGRRPRAASLRDAARPHRDHHLHGRLLPGDGARAGVGRRGRDLLSDQLAQRKKSVAELDGPFPGERSLFPRRQSLWAGTRRAVLRRLGGDRPGWHSAERPRLRRRHRLGLGRCGAVPRQTGTCRMRRRSLRGPPSGRLRGGDAEQLPLELGCLPRLVRRPAAARASPLPGRGRPNRPGRRRRPWQSGTDRAGNRRVAGGRSDRLPGARRLRPGMRSSRRRAAGGDDSGAEHRASARDRRRVRRVPDRRIGGAGWRRAVGSSTAPS